MSKSLHAFSSILSESDDSSAVYTESAPIYGAKSEGAASQSKSKVCTMTESEIRTRLDAFAKELARAKRERATH